MTIDNVWPEMSVFLLFGPIWSSLLEWSVSVCMHHSPHGAALARMSLGMEENECQRMSVSQTPGRKILPIFYLEDILTLSLRHRMEDHISHHHPVPQIHQ